MLQKFVSGSAIAGLTIACAVFGLIAATPMFALQKPYLLPLTWCFMPAVWGVWAMLTPRTWMPSRLPLWGAMLGLLLSLNSAFVLNMPKQVSGDYMRIRWRLAGVIGISIGYYLLWMIVRLVYRALTPAEPVQKEFKAAA